jgi:uncharacterized repeat protein (TIGR01451 family)
VGWRWRACWTFVVVLLGVLGMSSSAAADSQCPVATPSVFGPCGPTFTLPQWGDAGGWKSPDQYSTIQFGDVLGNGQDQLIGRSADGIEIWSFDKTVGQWRPAVDSQGKPMILTEFADPPALTQARPTFAGTDWTDVSHYTTIEVADVLGDGHNQIIARGNSGIVIYSYTPGVNGAPGTWSQVYPFSDRYPFSNDDGYGGVQGALSSATIQAADLTGGNFAVPTGRSADLFAVSPSGDAIAYEWSGGDFYVLPEIPGHFSPGSPQANTLHASPMIDGRQELWWADTFGMVGIRLNAAGTGWSYVSQPQPTSPGPCALNETSPTPWASSPAYYDTCRAVNVTGTSNAEVVGRGVDGLHVWELTAQGVWQQLATLGALSDANGFNQQKYWASIQYANLDGSASGQQELVARGPNGVVAYKYDTAANQWNQLPSTNAISLTDDPWGSDPSYYSTLRLGDASGDGRQDTLIARGPYGIRTWFYGRPGQTGWSTYAPSGYPAFTGAQQSAYVTANQLPAVQAQLAGANVTTIRDYLQTENQPAAASLAGLQSVLASAAGCSGEQTFAPPQYQSCIPPSGSTGFTAQDWTSVVNELLSEAWDAQQVAAFYTELDGIRQHLFIAEGAELPAIAGSLELSAATNTATDFNMVGASSAMLGIAASVAFEFPELSAALWVASELVSMFPSASPDLTSPFDGTYNQLQNVFASGISETQKAEASQSLQVRSDLNLMRLVAQLRQRGTWAMDDIGVQSASNEGFALWVYKTLMPALYTRYQVSNCSTAGVYRYGSYGAPVNCTGPMAGVPGVAGSVPNFSEIGAPQPSREEAPPSVCYGLALTDYCPYQDQLVDSSVASKIWGLVSASCNYQPGNPNTEWTFGRCNLGVDPATSVQSNLTSIKESWNFPTVIGDPTDFAHGFGGAAGSGRTSSVGRAATVSLGGTFTGVGPVDLSRATVVLHSVLFDPNGRRELVRSKVVGLGGSQGGISSSPLGPVTLHPTGRGSFQMAESASARRPLATADAPTAPSIKLELAPRRGHSLAFGLQVAGVVIPVPPAACGAAAIGLTASPEPFPLTLKLSLREPGRKVRVLSVSPLFSCQRDQTGAIRALTVVQPRHQKLGRGLSVQISRPGRLTVGQRATLTVTVRNRTRTTAYDVSIRAFVPRGLRVLRHSRGAIVRNGLIVLRVTKLRSGKAQTIRLALAPTTPARQCATVIAAAILRKEATRGACIDVIAAPRPATGLG